MSLRHLLGRRFVSLPLLILYKARVVTLQSLANCPKPTRKHHPIWANPSESTPIPQQSLANPSPIPHQSFSSTPQHRHPPRPKSELIPHPSLTPEAQKGEKTRAPHPTTWELHPATFMGNLRVRGFRCKGFGLSHLESKCEMKCETFGFEM